MRVTIVADVGAGSSSPGLGCSNAVCLMFMDAKIKSCVIKCAVKVYQSLVGCDVIACSVFCNHAAKYCILVKQSGNRVNLTNDIALISKVKHDQPHTDYTTTDAAETSLP